PAPVQVSSFSRRQTSSRRVSSRSRSSEQAPDAPVDGNHAETGASGPRRAMPLAKQRKEKV
ncbi:MAG: hypothetical protein K8I27_12080, partial [Planctomycetes bacterium]|nr:hypothetical protein [Planctomycetota bacterium]